jgi:hypothetical protein
MVGLVPTIHDFFSSVDLGGRQKKSWMLATSASMTTS